MVKTNNKYYLFLIFLLLIPQKVFCHPTVEKSVFIYFQLFFVSAIVAILAKYIFFRLIIREKGKKRLIKLIFNSLYELILITIIFSIILKSRIKFIGLHFYGETLIIFFILSFLTNYFFNHFIFFKGDNYSKQRLFFINIIFSLIFPILIILIYFIFLKLGILLFLSNWTYF